MGRKSLRRCSIRHRNRAAPRNRGSRSHPSHLEWNAVTRPGPVPIRVSNYLYSDRCNALFTVIEDTCGSHDTIAGCCSGAANFLRYGVRGTPNCYANFLEILRKFGLGRHEIVANVNFFMYVPIERDGAMAIADGL